MMVEGYPDSTVLLYTVEQAERRLIGGAAYFSIEGED